VAVISSGVDAAHPQLAGRVLPGADFLYSGGTAPGNTDCAGLGTQIGGVIAAQPVPGTGFHGLAPGALLLPVTVSETEDVAVPAGAAGATDRAVDAAAFARAITWAVDARARVLAVGVTSWADHPLVRAAITYALAHDVVVVAAASSAERSGTANKRPGSPPARPYPAAYPGVVGVGAIGPDGSLEPGSARGGGDTGDVGGVGGVGDVDLVAPGAGLWSTQRGGGYVPVEGTGIATGFVSAAAALVRSRWPGLGAADVARRLVASASSAPLGPDRRAYGHGIVDPYRAVTESLQTGMPRRLPDFTRSYPDAGRRAGQAAGLASRRNALLLAAAGVVAMAAVLVMGVAVPRGRRRRWRPVLAGSPDRRCSLDQEDVAPPRPLFALDPDTDSQYYDNGRDELGRR
jgi:hypothetical protein